MSFNFFGEEKKPHVIKVVDIPQGPLPESRRGVNRCHDVTSQTNAVKRLNRMEVLKAKRRTPNHGCPESVIVSYNLLRSSLDKMSRRRASGLFLLENTTMKDCMTLARVGLLVKVYDEYLLRLIGNPSDDALKIDITTKGIEELFKRREVHKESKKYKTFFKEWHTLHEGIKHMRNSVGAVSGFLFRNLQKVSVMCQCDSDPLYRLDGKGETHGIEDVLKDGERFDYFGLARKLGLDYKSLFFKRVEKQGKASGWLVFDHPTALYTYRSVTHA